MKAVAAARQRWARRRSDAPVVGLRTPAPGAGIALGAIVLLIALALAIFACAAIGVSTTQHDDSRREAERHASLQVVLDQLGPIQGERDHFTAEQLAMIGQHAGLADLRFDADLSADRDREVQSLTDDQGRIVGWFSWTPDRSLIHTMDRLWAVAGVMAVILALCALIALRVTRRVATALKRQSSALEKLTTRDATTGLANRRVVIARLEEALLHRGTGVVVFARIDIDNTEDINDTLGHAGSETLFGTIAERLKTVLPAGALLGRFAAGEFAALVSGGDGNTATRLGERLTSILAEPIQMDQPWHITASIGMAQAPDDGTTGDELLRRASLALRAAKQGGHGTVRRFVPLIHEEHAERRFILKELEAAIESNSFETHYQPVVAAEGGGMLGVEALLRWNHPTRGAIPPSVFIPFAEENGLMNRLGELVLRQALIDGARWPTLFVSVNLSPVQMRSAGLVDVVVRLLKETGMATSRLVLEVTEGILITNPEETLTRLEALRALGISTALDDFGSGYSSLNYLQKFPFDRLKIDRAFVASLGTTAHTGAIIQATVSLGHALGMKVLAEGVETNEQRVLLRLAGCDEMQGFLFAKPSPAEAIDKILAKPKTSRRAS
ncbi:MAG TPA: bifunctional diguanylate cyclase/phosphodiesterase [Xanthobacteraceae bacterium]|jgi:diguanylate cyclase (GGDEF)-like protein|nr:bifunctional diguanylate cyclase/phosphodiesterase [Xanthobacteraceae bacterium]